MKHFAIASILTLTGITAAADVIVFEAPTAAPLIRVQAWGTIRITGTSSRRIEMTVTPTARGATAKIEKRRPIGIALAGGTIVAWSDVAGDVELRVPRNAQLSVRSLRWGNVIVESLCGDVEVTAHEGGVRLERVGGAAVAHAGNGSIHADFAWSSPQPVSLTSMHGAIDIRIPSGIALLPRLRTDAGRIRSDLAWEEALRPRPHPVIEEALTVLLAYTRFGAINLRSTSERPNCH